MTATELDALAQQKKAIREAAHEARRAQPEKDETSRRILARLFELPEYHAARCVLFYVDVRTEVRTRHDLTVALAHGKRIAVPFCVDMPFPGGIAASGSKAGSRYKFSIASTYAEFCPTLRDKLGQNSRVPVGVGSIMEIILNGRDLASIERATEAAIAAAVDTPGLLRISAGNYGGRLGKSFIYLRPESAAAARAAAPA